MLFAYHNIESNEDHQANYVKRQSHANVININRTKFRRCLKSICQGITLCLYVRKFSPAQQEVLKQSCSMKLSCMSMLLESYLLSWMLKDWHTCFHFFCLPKSGGRWVASATLSFCFLAWSFLSCKGTWYLPGWRQVKHLFVRLSKSLYPDL